MRRTAWPTALLLASLALVAGSGCGLFFPSDDFDEDLPPRATAWTHTTEHLAWTPDGIFGIGRSGVHRYDGEATTTLLPASAVPSGPDRVSVERAATAFVGGETLAYLLPQERDDCPIGRIRVLDPATGRLRALPCASDFTVAPDGSRLAYATSDPSYFRPNLYVADLRDGVEIVPGSTQRIGMGFPVGFDPTGDRLLYHADDPALSLVPVLFDLPAAAADTLGFEAASFVRYDATDVAWTESGLHLLYSQNGERDGASVVTGVYVWSSRDEVHKRVWAADEREHFNATPWRPVIWGPPGTVLAWTRRCYRGWASCSRVRNSLWRIDTATGRGEPLARAEDGRPTVALSPDGREVAFSLGTQATRLYRLSLYDGP